ncbi:MAG: PQQ-dependent sugar dehydrogenase [Planctomycetota bacterium]|nr:PQQ-dependent sugar dehydrogenase [Planctomycetota bacterium]
MLRVLLSLSLFAMSLPAQELPEVEFVETLSTDGVFARPLLVEYHETDPEHCLVAEQFGKVWRMRRDGEGGRELWLDMSRKAFHPRNGGFDEEGLLGMAFDPEFAKNGHVFLYYSEKADAPQEEGRRRGRRRQVGRQSVVSRMKVDLETWEVDPDSELRILEVAQPWPNHNGGTILFGPDKMLYIALGDGGARADRGKHGQNLGTLLASIVRIDVRDATEDQPYRIPADNPFVDTEGARGEIWAYGLRNPWRIAFDRKTGDLWCGDVGQDAYEEIDRLVAGGNYGWPVREGFHAFPKGRDGSEDPEFIEPVAEYPRGDGISVTGGHVYRGSEIPELDGWYIYGDYVTMRMWAVKEDRSDAKQHEVQRIGRAPGQIGSFAETPDGELLALCFNGRIYRLVRAAN